MTPKAPNPDPPTTGRPKAPPGPPALESINLVNHTATLSDGTVIRPPDGDTWTERTKKRPIRTRSKSLKFTVDEWAAIEKAAAGAHMSMHAWIRAVVTVALGKSALPEHIRRLAPEPRFTLTARKPTQAEIDKVREAIEILKKNQPDPDREPA